MNLNSQGFVKHKGKVCTINIICFISLKYCSKASSAIQSKGETGGDIQCGLSTVTMQSLAAYSSNGPRKNKKNENRKKKNHKWCYITHVKKNELKLLC